MSKNNKRNISKKTRFEVFKRDNFTCQYCGRMAPDVILEIDHINPISNGGNNNILNLITSCFECNRGKGKRTLTENEEIKKQQEMLKEINIKREQLEMLLKWKQELEELDNKMIDEIEDLLSITKKSFSEYGRQNCLKLIQKYGFDEVYKSTKISIQQYYVEDDEDSIIKTVNYISRICAVRQKQKENPKIYKINYLCKIAKNRFYYFNEIKIKKFLNDNLEDDDYDYIKELFCICNNWTELKEYLFDYYGKEV